jgi:hypothetical protein
MRVARLVQAVCWEDQSPPGYGERSHQWRWVELDAGRPSWAKGSGSGATAKGARLLLPLI